MHILYPVAKRFIAGEDMPSALQSIQSLASAGFDSTVDHLGEHTVSLDQAEDAKNEYLRFLDRVKELDRPMDFSVKLSQMGLDIGRQVCRDNVMDILKACGKHTVRFDMESSDTTEDTINLCLDMHETWPQLGIALQAYQHRTPEDVHCMIEKGVSVRLCKGAYKEPPEVALQDMGEIQEHFLQMAWPLLKEGLLSCMATHDEYLIGRILKFVEKEKIEPKSFYFEMLYGVRRDIQKDLHDRGFQVRIYVPYGKSWLPYTLRRLAERKENVLFVVKNLFRETVGLKDIN